VFGFGFSCFVFFWKKKKVFWLDCTFNIYEFFFCL
jgi:hypothetical protein